MYNLYDVYDMGKLIMQNVTNKEVAVALDCKIVVSTYAKNNKSYHGRYRFTIAGEPIIEPELKGIVGLYDEWDKMKDIADKIKSGKCRIVENNGIKYAEVV
jgi:hypothetical protein